LDGREPVADSVPIFVLDIGELGDRRLGLRFRGRLRGLEIVYLGVLGFAGLSVAHQDRLQIQDLTNAKTSTLDGDPGTGLDPKTAIHATTPQDSLSHIRLCIVSGWRRSVPICRLAISCHNMGNNQWC
jgi:hypothetical protein